MTAAKTSYRDSHQAKGADYHALFSENPRRALLWRLERRALDAIVRRFLSGRQIAHLDFACGTGRILAHLAPNVAASVGVDLSPSMLAVAEQVAPQARLIEADLTHDNVLAGRQFDLITAFRFFPNAEPQLRREVLQVLVPLLAPGGILVFNNHQHDGSLLYRIVRWLKRGRVDLKGMTRSEVDALVREAGLTIQAVYHQGIVPESERRTLRPRFLIAGIESLAARLPLARWSEDLIFVCAKAS